MSSFLYFLNRYWKLCSICLLLVIGFLSLLPLSELPAPGGDKLHHLIAYTALVIPVALHKPAYWWLIVLFYFGFSGAIELIQPYVNRYRDWLDMAANGIGLLSGMLFAELLIKCFPARLKRNE